MREERQRDREWEINVYFSVSLAALDRAYEALSLLTWAIGKRKSVGGIKEQSKGWAGSVAAPKQSRRASRA